MTADPSLNGGTNFAFGGARTGPIGAVPPTLQDQLAAFSFVTGGVAPSNALYVVWGGGNNLLNAAALKLGGDDAGASAVVGASVIDIATIVGSLSAAGAVDILVPNQSDLGLNPASALGGFSSEASAVSTEFNTGLGIALSGFIADPAINLIELDIFGLTTSIVASPGSFGLTNATDPCVDFFAVCSNPEDFLFYDGIHPTAAGHVQIANLAHAALVPEPIPEPSTILLFGSGLVGLFLLRRKISR